MGVTRLDRMWRGPAVQNNADASNTALVYVMMTTYKDGIKAIASDTPNPTGTQVA